MFTKDQLDEVFFISEEGYIFWKYNRKQACHFTGGYRKVWWGGTKYYAHHIVWCITFGYWPERIDHKNGNGDDNRPDNLREATQSQNLANRIYGKMRGIESHGKKWRVRIQVGGQRIELGSYTTKEEAMAAYKAGAEKYFGEFAEHNRDLQ